MTIQENLQYTKSHEWVLFLDDSTAKIGLTDYAQESLGSIVFVNLPGEGDALTAGESLGDVESVKAVSDVISPVSGLVAAINDELLDSPEKINEEPYETWLVQVSGITGKEALLSPQEYQAFCNEED